MLLPYECTTLYNYSEGVASAVQWFGQLVTAGHTTPGAALCHCARLVFYCEYVELVPTQARSRGSSVRSVPAPRMLCKLTSQVPHMCHFTAILAVLL